MTLFDDDDDENRFIVFFFDKKAIISKIDDVTQIYRLYGCLLTFFYSSYYVLLLCSPVSMLLTIDDVE